MNKPYYPANLVIFCSLCGVSMKGDLTKASGTSNHLYVQKDFVQGIFHEDEFKISVETYPD